MGWRLCLIWRKSPAYGLIFWINSTVNGANGRFHASFIPPFSTACPFQKKDVCVERLVIFHCVNGLILG